MHRLSRKFQLILPLITCNYASNIRLRESKFFSNLGGGDTRFEGGTNCA